MSRMISAISAAPPKMPSHHQRDLARIGAAARRSCATRGPQSSSIARAVSTPDSGTRMSRGPGRQEVGHVEARACGGARSARPPRAAAPGSSRPRAGCARAGHRTSGPSRVARVDLAGALVRLAQRDLDRLAAARHERHAAAARRSAPSPACSLPHDGQTSDVAHSTTIGSPPDPPVVDPPSADLRLARERDDHVDPVRVVGEVDVGLRRLGRAARVRVVDRRPRGPRRRARWRRTGS